MRKNFYLSTRKDRLHHAAPLLKALKASGWNQTFAWTDQTSSDAAAYAEIAKAELGGVHEADVLIVLLPGGFGTHVEIGAALALGKPIIIHAPDRKTLETPYPCVFHYHPLVTLLVSENVDINSVLASLRNAELLP
jgi:nucleoside 2-deoxyribosyltransferase